MKQNVFRAEQIYSCLFVWKCNVGSYSLLENKNTNNWLNQSEVMFDGVKSSFEQLTKILLFTSCFWN